VIAAACPFKIFAVAFRTKKQEKKTSGLQKVKKRAAFPPVSWGLG
jgi:hypothetical protein